jgi:hypothetical protein
MEAGVVVAVVTVSLVIGATAVKVVAWVFKAAVRSALEPI